MSRSKLEGTDIPFTGIQFNRMVRDGSARVMPLVGRASAVLFIECAFSREYRSSSVRLAKRSICTQRAICLTIKLFRPHTCSCHAKLLPPIGPIVSIFRNLSGHFR